jgi:hypothetical protein
MVAMLLQARGAAETAIGPRKLAAVLARAPLLAVQGPFLLPALPVLMAGGAAARPELGAGMSAVEAIGLIHLTLARPCYIG